MLHLSTGQKRVLSNTLAWCPEDYEPTEEAIVAFFAWNDRGEKLQGVAAELFHGWNAHYSNPWGWVRAWESKESKNPPIAAPAAWIYDAYFSDGTMWAGWLPLFVDFFRAKNWPRVRPAYEVAYKMAAYHHDHLTAKEARARG